MILANVRERLTPSDMDLVVRLLARGDEAGEARYRGRLAERGRDALLDEPQLFELLCRAPGIAAPSAPLFIYVAVRHALRRVEIDDPELGDYLSALLLEFGTRDRAHRISPADDQVYRYVSDIVADLDLVADARRAFLLRAHLGNFSLWLAGVFPTPLPRVHSGMAGRTWAITKRWGREASAWHPTTNSPRHGISPSSITARPSRSSGSAWASTACQISCCSATTPVATA